MAGKGGRAAPSVIERLEADPAGFGFFQAARLLELAGRKAGRAPVSGDGDPKDEAVRFRASVSLEHPASEVTRISPGQGGAPPEMAVAFMGLVGPSGVLPEHYTEQLIEVTRQKNTAFRDFLDLLTHRPLSFFYQAWARRQMTVAGERRAAGLPGQDQLGGVLAALTGLGTPGLQHALPFGRDLALHHAGQIANRRHTARSVQALAESLLGRPVAVLQLQGAWLPIEPDGRTRLPGPMQPMGQHARLGQDAVLGVRAWDAQAGFTLRIGPLTEAGFRDLMPDGAMLQRLVELVRFVVGPAQGFAVQPVLRGDAVPRARLAGTETGGARLGWNSWLGNPARGGTRPNRGEALFDGQTLGNAARPDRQTDTEDQERP